MFTEMIKTATKLKSEGYSIKMVRDSLLDNYSSASSDFIEQAIKKVFGILAYYFTI
jgi:hypothetical protein